MSYSKMVWCFGPALAVLILCGCSDDTASLRTVETDLGSTADSGQDGGGSGTSTDAANNHTGQSDCTEEGVCDCAELLPGSCSDLPDCGPTYATTMVVSDDGSCVREQRQIGCMSSGLNCPSNISYGSDTKGNCWSFPDDAVCVPERFTTTGAEAERCARLAGECS